MKVFILFAWFIGCLYICHADIDRFFWREDSYIDANNHPDRGAAAQHEAVAKWNVDIAKSNDLPADKAIPLLASAIRKMAMKNVFQIKERIATYDEARDRMLTIPGHAHYFEAEIKKMRAEVEDPNIRRWIGEYNRDRFCYIDETLKHLPSPECIQVLGDFLSDDLDKPGPIQPGQDWSPTPANSVIAAGALGQIGLRNPPETRDYLYGEAILTKWRAWYTKVKAGEQWFSFIGKDVEYRFKPDGSVEQRPYTGPADAPAPQKTSASPVVPSPQAPPPSSPAPVPAAKPSAMPWYIWLGGALVVLLGALGLWLRKGRRAMP